MSQDLALPQVEQKLTEAAQRLCHFRLPRWLDLPEQALLREALLDYVTATLSPIWDDSKILTGTMVQNYAKWGLVARPQGRYYQRDHLAYYLVLSLLKGILPTQSIRQGISLQTQLMSLPAAYDYFAEQFEQSLRRACAFAVQPLVPRQDKYDFAAFSVPGERLALALICEALAFKLLTQLIIANQGFAALLPQPINTADNN